MGAHSASRKNSKTWLVPAVGTVAAVAGQGLAALPADAAPQAASTAVVSGVTAGAGLSIAPALQPEEAAVATLAQQFQARKMKTPRLTQGLRGSGYVLWVQKKLGVMPRTAKLGKTPAAGYFGPKTRAAVLRFQRENGLSAVGSVGPKTWKALMKVGAGKTYKFKAKKARAEASRSSTSKARASRSAARTPLKSTVSGSRVNRILALAASQDGRQYVWGGNGGSGFDCSGYVGWVFRQVGVKLPRVSGDIYDSVRHISKSESRPGDLFFVRNGSGRIYHVGIVGKNGTWWEARNQRYDVGQFDPWASGSKVVYGRA